MGGLETVLHPSFIPLGPITQYFPRSSNCKVDLPSGKTMQPDILISPTDESDISGSQICLHVVR